MERTSGGYGSDSTNELADLFKTNINQHTQQPKLSKISKDFIAGETKRYRRCDRKKHNKPHLKCDVRGMKRHTKEQCFQIVGYPEWWSDNHKKGTKPPAKVTPTAHNSTNNRGRTGQSRTGFGGLVAAGDNHDHDVAAGDNHDEEVTAKEKRDKRGNHNIPIKSQCGGWTFSFCNTKPNFNNHYFQNDPLSICGDAKVAKDVLKENSGEWIFDCGATDTMSCELSDFKVLTKPKKSYIQAANGEKMNVKSGGTVEISPRIKLRNSLYVPSLSHKLLSVSHVTKELNCSVIMHPTFCLLQDIRTGQIIGRGTENNGLYYVDEVTQSGTVMLAHGTTEREAWLWHRRLGHPSAGISGCFEAISLQF